MQKTGKAPFNDTPGVLRTSQIHFLCYFIFKQEFHSCHIHVRFNPLKSRGTAFLCGWLVVPWSGSCVSLNMETWGGGVNCQNSPEIQRAGIVNYLH